jgi:hypothetical protein
MKLYKDYQFASISMANDDMLLDVLKKVSTKYIIECGTYLGTGSTKMLASLNPERLITIECSYLNYIKAKKNLEKYSFVECYHGLSVGIDESVSFMSNNSYIFEDDVFVDDENPLKFYTNEIAGMLSGGDTIDGMNENLLLSLLPEIADKCPLIVLDSAGGIGLFEFRRVKQIMGDRPYVLLLDDTHHVKHYRSKLEIYSDDDFTVIYENKAHGSLIATHKMRLNISPIVHTPKTVYVVLGRFGDIYIVGRNLKEPSILCCSTRFSQMAKEMFPQHEIYELHPRYAEGPAKAAEICELKFPSKRVIICQQDEQERSLMLPFRSFQSFQEYYANI